ncbi:MAG: chaplin family protein [Actinoallomurus sp.]
MLKKLTAAGLVAVAASGAILLASPANALSVGLNTNTGLNTNGDGGVVSGNTLIIPVSIPVSLCGDSIALIGRGQAGCRGGASVGAGPHHHPWDS